MENYRKANTLQEAHQMVMDYNCLVQWRMDALVDRRDQLLQERIEDYKSCLPTEHKGSLLIKLKR